MCGKWHDRKHEWRYVFYWDKVERWGVEPGCINVKRHLQKPLTCEVKTMYIMKMLVVILNDDETMFVEPFLRRRCVNRLRCSFRCFLRFYAKGSHIIGLYVWGGYYTVERKNYRRKELAASYTFPIF